MGEPTPLCPHGFRWDKCPQEVYGPLRIGKPNPNTTSAASVDYSQTVWLGTLPIGIYDIENFCPATGWSLPHNYKRGWSFHKVCVDCRWVAGR